MQCHKHDICCDDRMFVDACPRENSHCGCWDDYDFDWGDCQSSDEECCPPCEEHCCCQKCPNICSQQSAERSDSEDYEIKPV